MTRDYFTPSYQFAAGLDVNKMQTTATVHTLESGREALRV